MNLYKITATIPSDKLDEPDMKFVRWAGSQTEAAAARKAALELGATRKTTDTATVDVPTGKAGLIEFLNGLSAA